MDEQTQRVTEWMPYSLRPVRCGLYECSCGGMHFWCGFKWYRTYTNFKKDLQMTVLDNDIHSWRGLTKREYTKRFKRRIRRATNKSGLPG